MSSRKLSLLAKTFFLDSSVGGRSEPAAPGYRPNLRIKEYLTSCVINPVNESVKLMKTGEYYDVQIDIPLRAQIEEYMKLDLESYFCVGKQIQLSELYKIIAIGKIYAIKLDDIIKQES